MTNEYRIVLALDYDFGCFKKNPDLRLTPELIDNSQVTTFQLWVHSFKNVYVKA